MLAMRSLGPKRLDEGIMLEEGAGFGFALISYRLWIPIFVPLTTQISWIEASKRGFSFSYQHDDGEWRYVLHDRQFHPPSILIQPTLSISIFAPSFFRQSMSR